MWRAGSRETIRNGPQTKRAISYEIDKELCQTAREVLERAATYAAEKGINVHATLHEQDFVLDFAPAVPLYRFSADHSGRSTARPTYDYIIANPPYFKLSSDDLRAKAIIGRVNGQSNIYALFMALAVKMLTDQGRSCFIVPRSFCSGAYFSAFRKDFIRQAVPLAVHVFESRQDTFKGDSVLQENVIFTFRRRRSDEGQPHQPAHLSISTSKDATDLDRAPLSRRVSIEHFLGKHDNTLFFRLPTGELDEQILETIKNWKGSLNQYGLQVSTGPVVPFRARPLLMDVNAVTNHQAVPLLWMQNVKTHRVEWPVINGNKPQGISLDKEAVSLLVPTANYVLLRRFSAKEEPRRLIAAPLLTDQYPYPWIGLENHLNYIYRKQGGLSAEEALGLSALFNSTLMDRCFRIINGNTQVNAMELRSLPLPPLELIKKIGNKAVTVNEANAPVGLVVRNPDDPTLPTNSPRTHYALSDSAIRTIRSYRSEEWQKSTQSFIETQGCSASRVYVSAFPDFATFKSFLTEIAWRTEVWLAEMPSHLIHFNGDRFLGPRE